MYAIYKQTRKLCVLQYLSLGSDSSYISAPLGQEKHILLLIACSAISTNIRVILLNAEVIAVRRVWTKSVQVPNLLYFNNESVGKHKLLIASLVIQGSKLRLFPWSPIASS